MNNLVLNGLHWAAETHPRVVASLISSRLNPNDQVEKTKQENHKFGVSFADNYSKFLWIFSIVQTVQFVHPLYCPHVQLWQPDVGECLCSESYKSSSAMVRCIIGGKIEQLKQMIAFEGEL